MLLIVLAGVCLATVPLTGGRLSRLGRVELHRAWLAPAALAAQILIMSVAPHGHPAAHRLLHVATYVVGGAFLWANRRIRGVPLVAAGAALNALPIVVNRGVMPASASAQRLAGLQLGAGFQNSAHVAHAHLAWLGDIIPVPGLGPLSNVFSVGDLVIYAGLLVVLHAACRRPAPAAPAGTVIG
jgi:hypothetical protein